MKKIYIAMITGLFLALCATAFAMGPGPDDRGPWDCIPQKFGHMPPPPKPGLDKGPVHFVDLNLSRDQMLKMWQLEDTLHNDTRTLRFELFQKRMELDDMYANPKITDALIIAKQKEIDTTRQKLDDKMVQFMLAQRKILTPEQITKLGKPGFRPERHNMPGPGEKETGPGAH